MSDVDDVVDAETDRLIVMVEVLAARAAGAGFMAGLAAMMMFAMAALVWPRLSGWVFAYALVAAVLAHVAVAFVERRLAHDK